MKDTYEKISGSIEYKHIKQLFKIKDETRRFWDHDDPVLEMIDWDISRIIMCKNDKTYKGHKKIIKIHIDVNIDEFLESLLNYYNYYKYAKDYTNTNTDTDTNTVI